MQWAIGDWINFGFAQYVEAHRDKPDAPVYRVKYRIAMEALPYEFGTLRNIAWVCKSVILSRRRDRLTFKHHVEVASLPPKEQAKYLRIADESSPRMTVAQLRALIRRDMAEIDESHAPPPAHLGLFHYSEALNFVLTKEDPTRWEPERRLAVKEQLRPIVEFWERL